MRLVPRSGPQGCPRAALRDPTSWVCCPRLWGPEGGNRGAGGGLVSSRSTTPPSLGLETLSSSLRLPSLGLPAACLLLGLSAPPRPPWVQGAPTSPPSVLIVMSWVSAERARPYHRQGDTIVSERLLPLTLANLAKINTLDSVEESGAHRNNRGEGNELGDIVGKLRHRAGWFPAPTGSGAPPPRGGALGGSTHHGEAPSSCCTPSPPPPLGGHPRAGRELPSHLRLPGWELRDQTDSATVTRRDRGAARGGCSGLAQERVGGS